MEIYRPYPPKGMLQQIPTHDFAPAPEIEEWIRESILSPDGALYNPQIPASLRSLPQLNTVARCP